MMTQEIATLVGLVALPFTILAADSSEFLARQLEAAKDAETCLYRLRDSRGQGMDCLKVFQGVGSPAGVYWGVYHHRINGVFSVHLAESNDLRQWSHLVALDEHASQATVWPCEGGGLLLAYEKDAPNSCWIRLRYYDGFAQLRRGEHAREIDISRTLAPTAEGTPSIESVELGPTGVDGSTIEMRFHFFQNANVDQLAIGSLADFKTWKSEASAKINTDLRERGWLGNLGDRDKFVWRDQVFYLQEIQRRKGDWSSWRLGLCDGDGILIRALSIQTHRGSTAFANPSATWVVDSNGERKLVITTFLLSEGSARGEAGSLLYVIDPSKG